MRKSIYTIGKMSTTTGSLQVIYWFIF